MKNLVAPFLPAPLRKRVAPDWAPRPVVAVVRLAGIIGPSQPIRGGLNLAAVAPALEAAFAMKNAKAVALVINSPGGSPVQSSLIYKRIRQLAEEKSLPVYAFAEDVAASGGYMIACAADEIYADESSVIGSIGVVSAGFGFTGLIEKLGVERRVHTAGESKAMLDPFQPEKPDEVARLKALQEEVHENFKALVKKARGERLKADDPAIFSGEFWPICARICATSMATRSNCAWSSRGCPGGGRAAALPAGSGPLFRPSAAGLPPKWERGWPTG